jgi:hypothetical protein
MDITQLWNFPLAPYAAEHWVEHAQFEDILLDIRDWVDCLFDRNKPHLDNWIWLYNGRHGNRYHLRIAHDGSTKSHFITPRYLVSVIL